MDFVTVNIAVINTIPKRRLHPDDRHLPGIYSVQVEKELSQAERAAAALDVFHDERGVKVLDDFTIVAYDPKTGGVLAQPDDHENDTLTGAGRDFQMQSSTVPRLYAVHVRAKGDGLTSDLGTVKLLAFSQKQAQDRAHILRWDQKLTVAGCRAVFETKREA